MEFHKKIILPLTVMAMVGACAPFPELYVPEPLPPIDPTEQETILDVKKVEDAAKKKAAAVAARKNSAATRAANRKAASVAAWKEAQAQKTSTSTSTYVEPEYIPPAPVVEKKFYPTASPAAGKPGFVHNPYTNAQVNVIGIASGQLVRDPDDTNEKHMFRVP